MILGSLSLAFIPINASFRSSNERGNYSSATQNLSKLLGRQEPPRVSELEGGQVSALHAMRNGIVRGFKHALSFQQVQLRAAAPIQARRWQSTSPSTPQSPIPQRRWSTPLAETIAKAIEVRRFLPVFVNLR